MYGAIIDNTNTLDEYGLILLADVSYGTPAPRTKAVTIPEADGTLDLTEALTGAVRYGDRKIKFSLFAFRDIITGKPGKASEQSFAIIRQRLMNEIHGKRKKLWFPDDPDHYFIGRFNVGQKGAYNSGTIQVTVTADPWRYRNELTERFIQTDGTYYFQNEKKPSLPVFIRTGSGGTVTFNGVSKALYAGENTFDNIIFNEGRYAVTFAGITSTGGVTVKYQEGTL